MFVCNTCLKTWSENNQDIFWEHQSVCVL